MLDAVQPYARRSLITVTAPAIILSHPQLGENIGAAARAMKNFGLSDLRLVSPRVDWPNPRADAMAVGAADVLESARVFADPKAALGDLHLVFATTARERGIDQGSDDAGRSGAAAARGAARGEQTAASCSATSAPVSTMTRSRSPTRSSRFRRRSSRRSISGRRCCCSAMNGFASPTPRRRRASTMARSTASRRARRLFQLFEHLKRELLASGFLFPPSKEPPMIRHMRAMLNRAGLTDQEMRTIRGMIVALTRGKHRVDVRSDHLL